MSLEMERVLQIKLFLEESSSRQNGRRSKTIFSGKSIAEKLKMHTTINKI